MRTRSWCRHPLPIVALCALITCAGCGPKIRKANRTNKFYDGPTQSLGDVVTRINANNDRLKTLYLTHDFAAQIVEKTKAGKTRKTDVDGRGVIMYQAPDNLYMNGRHPLAGKIFEIGCNPEAYWLGVPQEKVDTVWHGRMEHLGKPCAQPIPIRPDLLMQVLGVSTIDPNLARFPAPVMRFNNDEDAYMLTWIAPDVDRFIAKREVWYDRKTMYPRLVNLFDPEGRILVSAYLSEHRRVKVDGVKEADWPFIPGKYELLFTADRSRMTIKVEDAYLRYKGAPDPRVFRLPNLDSYATQNQLDEACGD